ncbi:unnamed protein product, partial [Bubo scandiacus]
DINLLALAALGCNTKYPTENDWLASDRQGLNKPSKRVQSSKTKDPGTTQPTAPVLEPQRDPPSAHGGPPVSGSPLPG